MVTPRVVLAFSHMIVVGCLVLLAGTVQAQPCADPDGDGDITEADGIIALMAAADLESDCSPTICDINVDGIVDDTDGVLVFQKAAGLEVEDNCLETSGFPDNRVVILVESVIPFLEVPWQYVPQPLAEGGRPTPDPNDIVFCDNSFDDGVILLDNDEGDITIAFEDCLLDNTLFSGEILDASDGFELDITTLFFTEDELNYVGESLLVSDTGSSLRISGLFEVGAFFDTFLLEDLGDFVLSLFAFEVTPTGQIIAGRATLDLADSDFPPIQRIVMDFDGTNIARVTVTDESLLEKLFLFDLTQDRFV